MIYVFAGPSVSVVDACGVLEAAHYLPPAAQGDVYRVALERPSAIGLIDGYFHRVPAVWHKEILWAMAQGIRVYGAASLGALRAAELADYGMQGVGWVYEAFLAGTLEDDDEVAIAHAPEAYAFRPASEAMVNIRCTLQRACRDGVLDAPSAERLCALAKGLFYADRSYERVLSEAAGRVDPRRIDALRAWLPSGAINQKRADALALLRTMHADERARRPAPSPSYQFEHTAAWELARSASKRAVRRASDAETHAALPRERELAAESDDAVLTELKLAGALPAVSAAALARALALEIARQLDRRIEGSALYAAIAEFRHERGLETDDQFEQWLEAQEIASLDFFSEECLVRLVRSLFLRDGQRLLANQLRSTGNYGPLAARARDKQRVMASEVRGGTPAAPADAELLAWLCSARLNRALPDDPELLAQELVHAWGMETRSELFEALRGEYLYLQALDARKD